MSMDHMRSPQSDVTGYLLRLGGQFAGFILGLAAFALWLLPGASEGLSLVRLVSSLVLLLAGMSVVLGCASRK